MMTGACRRARGGTIMVDMDTTTELSTDPTRILGATGPAVSPIGLGCMGMSGMYGATDEAASIATIHAYLDAGGTLLDTGDFYGSGHNEWLIRQALAGRRRDDVVLSVKFGGLRGPDGSWGGQDARPAAVRNFLAYSLQRLGVDHIDIYRPARVDPDVPIEETVGALSELVQAGWIRHIGLSEVGSETLRRAAAVAPICDLQIEWSLLSREVEDSVWPTCQELGIGITAYGVLTRGLISGARPAAGDFRAASPRFQEANRAHNDELVRRLTGIAAAKGVTTAQLAIAWVAARGDTVVPVVGSRTVNQVTSTLAAADIVLTADDLAALDAAVPRGSVKGDRYPPAQMRALDSTRG
jgi:aryl-alcohol dehydrogenase-like predicted oxidoreductase